MEVNINSLVPIEKALNETESVFETVDDIESSDFKRYKPAYILMKYEESVEAS